MAMGTLWLTCIRMILAEVGANPSNHNDSVYGHDVL